MTHATCRLTAKNRDQLRNPTLGNRVWASCSRIERRGGFSAPACRAVASQSPGQCSLHMHTLSTRPAAVLPHHCVSWAAAAAAAAASAAMHWAVSCCSCAAHTISHCSEALMRPAFTIYTISDELTIFFKRIVPKNSLASSLRQMFCKPDFRRKSIVALASS